MNVLLIGHDANRAGAQLVLLQLMRLLKAEGVSMHLLLGEGGPLLDEYRQVAPVTVWPADDGRAIGPLADKVLGKLGRWEATRQQTLTRRQQSLARTLELATVDLVLVNTVTSSRWFRSLTLPDTLPVITFVHELAMSVRLYTQPDDLAYLLRRTSHLLAVSRATADFYVQTLGVDHARITLFTVIDTPSLDRAVQQAQHQPDPLPALGIPAGSVVVGGCGNAEWRKGNDLFVTLARMVTGRTEAVHFVWVGMPPGPYRDDLWLDVQKAGLTDRVHFVEPTPDVLRYLSRFDVFLLCSREDPYPLVVLESALAAVPVVAFAGAGGAPELIEADGGAVVPYLDLDAMTDALVNLIKTPADRRQRGQRLREKVLQRHPADQTVGVLLTIMRQQISD